VEKTPSVVDLAAYAPWIFLAKSFIAACSTVKNESMDVTTVGLWLFIVLVSVALLYDQATKRIPSRLRADQGPKSKFGIDPVNGFGSRPGPNGLE
jgi:hypothetical protein